MAVRPRAGMGAVDLGDVQAITGEVVEENETLFDMTFATMVEAFTEPLSAQELDDILSRLDLSALAGLVVSDPQAARGLLQAAREREE